MRTIARDGDALAKPTSLQRAAITLRAIHQRYEAGHNAYPLARSYSVNVAIDGRDMAWIAAAIDAVEEALVSSGGSEAG